ncbi:hypothetical protein GCM10027447_39430 [Glycomyces halotolerans]|uniref:hypothetical protein n=1 Tax=Priestia flexa TaxID=86664 RepID=UPI000C249E6C|nr:hypothetical protein [Priestia flexa]MEC0668048.1 hypothetical protein [Priestia flexa]MED3823052.1 hypothetical protein [Priestia flexa]
MSANDRRAKLAAKDRAKADQGEFFFARIKLSDGKIYPRPVFVIGKHLDSNDPEEVIVCFCTSTGPRTDYDRQVQLKEETFVRTNKIYNMSRDSILFKIHSSLTHEEIQDLLTYCRKAIS